MRSREKMLASMKMIEIGIAPYMYSPHNFLENEIESALKSLSTVDRKKAKRKFRKLYKKAYKKYGIAFTTSKKPTPGELRRRRAAVYRMILSELNTQEIT